MSIIFSKVVKFVYFFLLYVFILDFLVNFIVVKNNENLYYIRGNVRFFSFYIIFR